MDNLNKKTYVSYEDFGAVGDGIHDDFFAIKAAHDYANKNLLPVKATRKKTYRINDIVGDTGVANYISIRTDTDWQDVNFIIDDRGFTHKDKNNSAVFKVESDYPALIIKDKEEIGKIFEGRTIAEDFTGKIGWEAFGYEALLNVRNVNKKNYIRFGADATSGEPQEEIIVVSADGKIREETPFMFAYEDITDIRIYRVDERKISITGGKFTHIASDIPVTRENWGYFFRSFDIIRSGVTLSGFEHYVVGELPGSGAQDDTSPKAAPYAGFLGVSLATDVIISNCILSGRRYSGIAGTYDFGAGYSNNLTLINVNQHNYYKEDGVTPTMDYKTYWGIGGTNYCKNLTYDSCLLSRFDAHCGLYNGRIVNSTLCNVELIGAGEMVIENTRFTPVNLPPIMYRGDYGCTWRGTLLIKDSVIKSYYNLGLTVIAAGWINHDFGYVCHTPSVTVDNLSFENLDTDEVMLFSTSKDDYIYDKILKDGTENKNPHVPPKKMKVINEKHGMKYLLCDIPYYKDTEISGIKMVKPENK